VRVSESVHPVREENYHSQQIIHSQTFSTHYPVFAFLYQLLAKLWWKAGATFSYFGYYYTTCLFFFWKIQCKNHVKKFRSLKHSIHAVAYTCVLKTFKILFPTTNRDKDV